MHNHNKYFLFVFYVISSTSVCLALESRYTCLSSHRMKKSFVDCFLIMNTAISETGAYNLPAMGRPVLFDVFTTIVNISLTVNELKIISANNLEAHLTALLTQYWNDPRLGANENTRRMAVDGQIWKPEITNINGVKQGTNCDKTTFWRGYGEEGNVLYSEKIQLLGSCSEYFENFPFDTQICEFKFGSYRFPEDEVSLAWKNVGVILETESDMKEFRLTNVSTFIEMDIRDSGNFSVAVIHFSIARQSIHYIFCIVIPCFVLALLIYSTLWLSSKKLSVRFIALIICSVLLSFFYYKSVCSTHPESYLKILDIFVIINLGFAFLILLETIVRKIYYSGESSGVSDEKGSDIEQVKGEAKGCCRIKTIVKIVFPLLYVFTMTLYYQIFVGFHIFS